MNPRIIGQPDNRRMFSLCYKAIIQSGGQYNLRYTAVMWFVMISSKCDAVIKGNMVMIISVGLENLQEADKKYDLWLNNTRTL